MSKTITCSWEDVPHLTDDMKEKMLADMLPSQREARTSGIASVGSGAIYPVPESVIFCDPFKIPDLWPRAYGMDVGWNRTAAVWGAYDHDSDTWYLYSEHYIANAEPSVQADAIKARGVWIRGVIDPASRNRQQADGKNLFDLYSQRGLQLEKANNSVETGLLEVWQRLSTGRLKIFNHLLNWKMEFRHYRRDENGKIVKKDDHLMDSTRYLMMSGYEVALAPPNGDDDEFTDAVSSVSGKSKRGGY